MLEQANTRSQSEYLNYFSAFLSSNRNAFHAWRKEWVCTPKQWSALERWFRILLTIPFHRNGSFLCQTFHHITSKRALSEDSNFSTYNHLNKPKIVPIYLYVESSSIYFILFVRYFGTIIVKSGTLIQRTGFFSKCNGNSLF